MSSGRDANTTAPPPPAHIGSHESATDGTLGCDSRGSSRKDDCGSESADPEADHATSEENGGAA